MWASTWDGVITTALTSGQSITVAHTAENGYSGADEFSGVGDYDTSAGQLQTTASPTSTSITPANVGLVIGNVSHDDANGYPYTEDADSVGGDTWHSLTYIEDRIGGAYKITTSAVSQTYDPTLNGSDNVSTHIASWDEIPIPLYDVPPTDDVTTTGWSSTPLWSKIDDDPDSPDATVITATAS